MENKIKNCPFCGGNDLKMKKVKRTGISYKDKKVVKGIFDVWECQDCKEGFFHHWELSKDGKKL